MRPTPNADVVMKSNLQDFDPIAMGIAEDATAHIVALLTDLYSDQIKAVIREYATNAKDAQIEAGVVAPIEVTLPTHLSPLYTVRDKGVGLGRDEIRKIYSQYGASTKRETDAQNGMLGLGCKAALTYTNQFTVVSVKGGIRTTVMVSREDDDVPKMIVVDESPTTDPQGTEVQVPVKRDDMHAFERKAEEFFGYWDPSDVLINGKAPTPIIEDALKISDDMYLVHTGGYDPQHKIVMGDVAYPALDLTLGVQNGYSLVAFVPIGAVKFAPSREALMTTSHTRSTLERVKTEFQAKAAAAVQAEIDQQANHRDALKVVLRWAKTIPGVDRSALTFKGKEIPTIWEDPNGTAIQVPGDNYKLSAHSRGAKYVNAEVFDSTVWIYNYDRPSFTAGQKKKMNRWVADERYPKGMGQPRHFVLVTDKPDSPFIDPLNVVDWKVIEAIKLPRAASLGSSGRIPGSYDFFESGVWREGVEDTEIDTSYPVYYYVGNYHQAHTYKSMLDGTGKDYTLVCLQVNRLAKFQRNFPKATDVRTVVTEQFKKWSATITDEQKRALAVQSGNTIAYSHIDPSKVTDPDVKEAHRLANLDVSAVEKQVEAFRRLNSALTLDLPSYVSPLNRYPLLFNSYSAWRHMDHVYLYMNAVYAAIKAGQRAKP